jgi:hypothetical protein
MSTQPAAKSGAKVQASIRPTAAAPGKTATAKRAPQAPAKTPSKAPSKAPTKAKPAPVAKPKAVKEKKVKVVRDSFTIPKTEFTQIAEMKKRAMALGVEVKKSELIRAGLQLMTGLQDAAFKKALAAVPTLKTGRPAKD